MFRFVINTAKKLVWEKGDCEISPSELQSKLDRRERVTVVDVRDPQEWKAAHLRCAKLIPLAELEKSLSELPREELIVIHCQHGMRSMRALQFLRKHGFLQTKSLKGGLAAWRELIDPDLIRY